MCTSRSLSFCRMMAYVLVLVSYRHLDILFCGCPSSNSMFKRSFLSTTSSMGREGVFQDQTNHQSP